MSGWTVALQLLNYQNIPYRRGCVCRGVGGGCSCVVNTVNLMLNDDVIKGILWREKKFPTSLSVTEGLSRRPVWFLSGSSRPKFKHLACLGEIQLDSIPAAVDVDKESEIQAFRKGALSCRKLRAAVETHQDTGHRAIKLTSLPRVMKR